jgi:hypothetical protein
MKVKIKTDKGEREIEVKSPKGKHIKKLWRILIDAESGDMEAVDRLFTYIDELASELSGLSVDELDELEIDEKKKITEIPIKKAIEQINFTKLLPSAESSSARATNTS